MAAAKLDWLNLILKKSEILILNQKKVQKDLNCLNFLYIEIEDIYNFFLYKTCIFRSIN